MDVWDGATDGQWGSGGSGVVGFMDEGMVGGREGWGVRGWNT